MILTTTTKVRHAGVCWEWYSVTLVSRGTLMTWHHTQCNDITWCATHSPTSGHRLNPITQFNPSPYSRNYLSSECSLATDIKGIIWSTFPLSALDWWSSSGGCVRTGHPSYFIMWYEGRSNMKLTMSRGRARGGKIFYWGGKNILSRCNSVCFVTTLRFLELPFDQWLKTPLGVHSSEDPLGPTVSQQ